MDIKIHYVEAGSQNDKVLLCIHGNGEDNSFFEHQLEYFSKDYRVIAIDSRGHGKTDRGTEPLTIRQMSKDVLNFLNEHSLEKVDILGFSDGGNIAMILAMDHPEKVGKMVLNGSNLDPSGMQDKLTASIKRHYNKAVEDSDKDPEAKKKADLFGLMVNDPYINPKDLAKLDHPCLVIAGDKDMIKDEHTRLIAESIKNSELVIMEGDHFIAKKEHESFNKIVEDFLSK